MSERIPLDLSGLSQFRASALLGGSSAGGPAAVARVELSLIEFDREQPRRSLDPQLLGELAASIREHGVLEPVSLRRHEEEGRFVVNRGERRVRAARMAELTAIPAFLDERHDPFVQAAENLHREDMSVVELAHFIAAREREGFKRSEIARRLSKPPSFITEAAALNEASPELMRAVEKGQVSQDVRTLYRLVSVARREPEVERAVLERLEPVHRANVDAMIREARQGSGGLTFLARASRPAQSGGRTVLVVEHAGRRGSLRIKACDGEVGEVRFGDGSRDTVPLATLKLVCWATEEAEVASLPPATRSKDSSANHP